jgi:hypothetical protein
MNESEELISELSNKPLLIIDFLADAGGDPEEYGLDLGGTMSPAQPGAALGIFLAASAEHEPRLARAAELAASPAIDWVWFGQQLDHVLAMPGA